MSDIQNVTKGLQENKINGNVHNMFPYIPFLSGNRTWDSLLNHNRTVFEEMTSWKAFSWHIGMKTAF